MSLTESFLNLPLPPCRGIFRPGFVCQLRDEDESHREKTSRTRHSSRQSHSSCKGSSDEGERGFETTHVRVEGPGLIRQVTGFRQGRGRKPLRSFRACHEGGNKHLGSMGAKLSRTSSAEVRYLKPIGKPRFSAFFPLAPCYSLAHARRCGTPARLRTIHGEGQRPEEVEEEDSG